MAKLDQLYMDIAWRCSEESHAEPERRKVGSVLVKAGSIISFGWNGMPSGYDNGCEESVLVNQEGRLVFRTRTKPEVSHAELNMLGKLLESGGSAKDATLYVTLAPCLDCSRLIQRSGIIGVVYAQDYKNDQGLTLLRNRGIEVRKFSTR
jgi:dCMP deaminase